MKIKVLVLLGIIVAFGAALASRSNAATQTQASPARVHAYVKRLNPPVIGLQNFERSRAVNCRVEADLVVKDAQGRLAHRRVTTLFKELPALHQAARVDRRRVNKSRRALLGSITQVSCG